MTSAFPQPRSSKRSLVSADHASGRPPSPPAYSQSALAARFRGRRTGIFRTLPKKPPAKAERSGVRLGLRDTMTVTTFLKARTVNDILKAIYDVLEVHRTKSLWLNVRDAVMTHNEDSPQTLQDVLSGENRAVGGRCLARCLIIDFDNSAWLDHENPKPPKELMQCTGTPMYVARSACTREVLTDYGNRIIPRMPELSVEPRELYVRAHGQARYDRYNDTAMTRHGGSIPDFDDFDKPRVFYHRPEHEVESVYWYMTSVLLAVHPTGVEEEPGATQLLQVSWNRLLTNIIPDEPSIYTDPRDPILKQTEAAWRYVFLGDMKDVGGLLFKISCQIRPEYAFFARDLQQDHLHEAIQRLILQYLVDHKELIELDPEHSRPITAAKNDTELRALTGSGRTRVDTVAGDDAGMSHPIVIKPKRKCSDQTGRSSKRLRGNSGLPQAMEEYADDGA